MSELKHALANGEIIERRIDTIPIHLVLFSVGYLLVIRYISPVLVEIKNLH